MITEQLQRIERNSNAAASFKYNSSFDGIRCIAVFLVLLLHGSYGFFKGGWIGVDLFFVLSGYLITSLLKNEYRITGKINFKNFWIRRALKLIPPLIVAIILANIFWPFVPKSNEANRLMASAAGFFYFTNFINPKFLGPLSHLWSLSVEEHFYILWPVLMVILFLRKTKKFNINFLITIIVLLTVFRILGYYYNAYFNASQSGFFQLDASRSTIYRIDSIIYGCLLALVYEPNKNKIKKSVLVFLNCLVVLFILIPLLYFDHSDKWLKYGGFIIANVLCLFIVFFAIKQPHHFLLSNKVLRYFGKRSYGIYLYHFPIFLLLENLRKYHDVPNFLFVTFLRFGITFLVAELSFTLIENPILKYKKHYTAIASK